MTYSPGPELDAIVAQKVLGTNVAGMAWCWAPDGNWYVMYPIDGRPPEEHPGMKRPVALGVCCCLDDDDPADLMLPPRMFGGPHNTLCYDVVPAYSTDIAAAWVVVEKMQGAKWSFRLTWNCKWDDDVDLVLKEIMDPSGLCCGLIDASFGSAQYGLVQDTDKSPAMAICLAALRAVRVIQ